MCLHSRVPSWTSAPPPPKVTLFFFFFSPSTASFFNLIFFLPQRGPLPLTLRPRPSSPVRLWSFIGSFLPLVALSPRLPLLTGLVRLQYVRLPRSAPFYAVMIFPPLNHHSVLANCLIMSGFSLPPILFSFPHPSPLFFPLLRGVSSS